ncbi:MAG: hypothetical protein U0452_13780 [Anaerolineae bacterium]
MLSRKVTRVAVGYFVVISLFATLLSGASLLGAQDQVEPGWEIIQTCTDGLSYPVIPRSQWDFQGVIFSEGHSGVRAIRTDVDTSYFIAFGSDSTFPVAGAFSPDGKWFAYPVGRTGHYVTNSGGTDYVMDAIEVVSTSPARLVRRFEWHDWGMAIAPQYALSNVQWLDNERLFYPGGYISDADPYAFGVVNVTSNQLEPWSPAELSHYLYGVSPDATRGFVYESSSTPSMSYSPAYSMNLVNVITGSVINSIATDTVLEKVWQYDSAAFHTSNWDTDSTPKYQLASFSRDGATLDVLYTSDTDAAYNLSISPQDDLLAFTAGNQLFVADLTKRQLRDLCFSFGETGWEFPIVWSPDGRQLAFTYDSYPVLLSLDTLEMEVLDYPTGRLLGWYPVE